jgi:hypothetical protein
MVAALLLALAATAFRFNHSYVGARARAIEKAIGILEPAIPDLLEAFGLSAVRGREVRLEPHDACKALNADPFFRRPAFVPFLGAEVIHLCDPFFKRKPEEAAVLLGHELLHVAGLPDAHDGMGHQAGSLEISNRVRSVLKRHREGRRQEGLPPVPARRREARALERRTSDLRDQREDVPSIGLVHGPEVTHASGPTDCGFTVPRPCSYPGSRLSLNCPSSRCGSGRILPGAVAAKGASDHARIVPVRLE